MANTALNIFIFCIWSLHISMCPKASNYLVAMPQVVRWYKYYDGLTDRNNSLKFFLLVIYELLMSLSIINILMNL